MGEDMMDKYYDGRTGLSAYIGKHTGQLQVGILKNAYHAIVFGRLLLNQFAAVASKVTQITLFPSRHETSFEQTGSKKLTYPCRIFLVCLVSRNILDVAGIHDHNREAAGFKNVHHRLPINSRTFHRHMRYAKCQ